MTTALERNYDTDFKPGDNYKATLPDLQNTDGFKGAKVFLPMVGIHNFKMPLTFATANGNSQVIETSITGSVSLQAEKKGINMSRIIRTFYDVTKDDSQIFALSLANKVLDAYKRDLEEADARIVLTFAYPLLVESLRTGLSGWQYYDISLEVNELHGVRRNIIHLDYVYSSTCPCSLELSEHARNERNRMATPHSQRSVARISVELDNDKPVLLFEDLIEACRRAIPTETQVMVKREDEQAFAELNGSNPIFVEDASRLLYEQIAELSQVQDFLIICSHQESLHSHDAIAVVHRGDRFNPYSMDPKTFQTLIKR